MDTTLVNTRPADASALPGAGDRLAALYAVETLTSIAGTLMSVGVFFFMGDRYGWRMPQNFLLAAGQGLVYVPASLLAGPLSTRLGKRAALLAGYSLLAALALLAWRSPTPSAVAAVLLGYTFVIGLTWPVMESLVAGGGDPGGISRRLAIYNLLWPAGGAAAIAAEGFVIRHWAGGVFLIPMLVHLAAVGLLSFTFPTARPASEDQPAPHPEPEPQLLRSRTLALWLSRTALPATYTVVYGVMPMMQSLPTMQRLGMQSQTLVSSVWLLTRWVAFAVLALGTWWHTRPRTLLWAAVAMLVAFFGMTLRPTGGANPTLDLLSLIGWEAVLGLALGMIYSASLYFGMVLSEGSTAHGGYHEALIGLGWMIGPAAGAIAQAARPGDVWLGIAAVGGVITASVLLVLAVAIAGQRRTGGA